MISNDKGEQVLSGPAAVKSLEFWKRYVSLLSDSIIA
jgi:hypothetical protein